MFRFVKFFIQLDSMDMLNLSGSQGRTSQTIDELITRLFSKKPVDFTMIGDLHNFNCKELSYQSNCSSNKTTATLAMSHNLRRCRVILKRKNLALVLNGNCKPLEVIWSLQWRFGGWKLVPPFGGPRLALQVMKLNITNFVVVFCGMGWFGTW